MQHIYSTLDKEQGSYAQFLRRFFYHGHWLNRLKEYLENQSVHGVMIAGQTINGANNHGVITKCHATMVTNMRSSFGNKKYHLPCLPGKLVDGMS